MVRRKVTKETETETEKVTKETKTETEKVTDETEDIKMLRLIAEHGGRLTTADRMLIERLSERYGIGFTPRSAGCDTCYIEQACKVYAVIRGTERDSDGTIDGYRLRSGVNVTFRGFVINADTLTAENARQWLEAGLPEKFFDRLPEAVQEVTEETNMQRNEDNQEDTMEEA